MPTVYRTSALSTGDGRNGHIRTDDGELDLDLATPRCAGRPGRSDEPGARGRPSRAQSGPRGRLAVCRACRSCWSG